jgi:hypothetical protein
MLKSLVLVILVSPSLWSQDDPDLDREQKFHAIYQNYGQTATSDEVWSTAVSASKAQTYDIQAGDNLWSLSQTLFADSNFWPKIWSLNNSSIENPHEISPGQILQFVPGTMGQAPQVSVSDGLAKPVVPQPQDKPVPTDDFLNRIALPPPKYEAKPVSALPSSLPNWKFRGSSEQALKFELSPANKDFGNPEMSLGNYVVEADVQSAGEVLGAEGGNRSAINFQYITVELKAPPSEKKMLVVKMGEQVRDPVSGRKGKIFEVQGEIEIGDVVNSSENLYRALVTRSLSLVEKGAFLVSGSIPTYNINDDGQIVPIPAEVIGGNGTNGKLFGTENIVYLNVGSGQGLIPGQSLNVYRRIPVRNPHSMAFENPLLVGKVKVVNASENFSTAIVTKANDDIRKGDRTVNKSSAADDD